MSAKNSGTDITYGFVGKVTADAKLPMDRNEFKCPITYIEVRSLTRTGGFVCVTRGGLGQRFVHIHLESNINCNLHYEIEISGFCYEPPQQHLCEIPPTPPCDDEPCRQFTSCYNTSYIL